MVQFNIARCVVGDAVNASGNETFLRERGVDVTVLDDPACIALCRRFITEKPALWLEDWGGPRREQ
jgi:cytosine deaminase